MDNTTENSNKKRLGRGLGSLLGGGPSGVDFVESSAPTKPAAQAQQQPMNNQAADKMNTQTKSSEAHNNMEGKVWSIAIDKLVPGTFQPRQNFKKESLQELAQSIKENGLLQPITVRKRQAGGFEIIAGERRWRAAQIAGLHEIPALVKDIKDRDALQLAIIENVQREDLDPIEEAEGYQRLIEEFQLSQQDVAEKVGKERSTVTNALRLLALPVDIKKMVQEKMLSTGHAKVLLSVADRNKQLKLAQEAAQKGMSVRALEMAIKFYKNSDNSIASVAKGLDLDLAGRLAKDLAEQLQKSLGTKVEIDYKKGKGSVSIKFYTDEQLTQIFEKLKGS